MVQLRPPSSIVPLLVVSQFQGCVRANIQLADVDQHQHFRLDLTYMVARIPVRHWPACKQLKEPNALDLMP